MNWSTIWELIKINILYSNPQSVTAAKRKKERRANKHFSAYKSLMQQQGILCLVFSAIYIYLYTGIDFRHYPGYFSAYIGIFMIVSLFSGFSALYGIFYESNDTKIYAPLPIKSSELYVAKVISSFGMTAVFLTPLISLLFIAYKQLRGIIWAIPLTVLMFSILFLSTTILTLYLNALVGKIIVRSRHRKLISTILMSISTVASVGVILYMNVVNTQDTMQGRILSDRLSLPYFRGGYDVVQAPFQTLALLHFWLPLLIMLLLAVGVVTYLIPSYFREVIYAPKPSAKKKETRIKHRSLPSVMVRHHLSTLQSATLLVQTYLMPLFYVAIFITPVLTSGVSFTQLSSDYFGVALVVGAMFGGLSCTANTFVGVGVSLERSDLIFIKSLPINLKGFLVQKYLVLVSLQASVPALAYLVISLFVLKLPLVLTLAFWWECLQSFSYKDSGFIEEMCVC